MLSVDQYNKLIVYASACIRNLKLSIQAGDLISEAYLFLDGNDISVEKLKEAIGKVANDEKYLLLNTNGYNDERLADQTKFCKKCDDDKPIAAFGVTVRKKTGATIIQPYCKECQAKMMAKLQSSQEYLKKRLSSRNKASLKHYYKVRDTEEYKSQKNKYMRDYNKRKGITFKNKQSISPKIVIAYQGIPFNYIPPEMKKIKSLTEKELFILSIKTSRYIYNGL